MICKEYSETDTKQGKVKGYHNKISDTTLLSPFSPPIRMSLGLAEVIMSKNCELNWKISMFLVDCGKSVIRRSQVRIIFQLILTIIEEKGLNALDSQDIILSDTPMEKLTGMPHLHLHQLRDCVMSLLTISDSGRRVLNPTDRYKVMIHRIFPQYLPTRDAEGDAPPIQTVNPLQTEVKWTMQEDLSILLIGFVSTEPVEFNSILTLLTNYISQTDQDSCTP